MWIHDTLCNEQIFLNYKKKNATKEPNAEAYSIISIIIALMYNNIMFTIIQGFEKTLHHDPNNCNARLIAFCNREGYSQVFKNHAPGLAPF